MPASALETRRGKTVTSCGPYVFVNSGPLRRAFCRMSFARYTNSSWRDGGARMASAAQTAAESLADFLWYCTQCESVWIDCCDSLSCAREGLKAWAVRNKASRTTAPRVRFLGPPWTACPRRTRA